MADIIKTQRIDELERLYFQNSGGDETSQEQTHSSGQPQTIEQGQSTALYQSGETLGDGDLTIVSHVNGQKNKTETRSVSLEDIKAYIVDYLKTERPLKFQDIQDGDEIMENIENRNQLNSFTDKVYSKSESFILTSNPNFQSGQYDYYVTNEDIVIEDDCIAHIHADVRLGGVDSATYNKNPKVDDVIELQLKNADNEWVAICSQQLNSVSGLVELDYHMKVQAGCTFRIATNKRGDVTLLGKAGRINPNGSAVTLDLFSNDTPFINSIKSKYAPLGNNKTASTSINTSTYPMVVDKSGVVWFKGTYTQASEISATINSRPYHTQTVYAQARREDGTRYLGNTESSIQTKKTIKTEYDFNNLFYYISADQENNVSITMSADTALYDPNGKSVYNGFYEPTKITYCNQISDLVRKFNLEEDTNISSLKQLQNGFSNPIATFKYAPFQPFFQYKNNKNANIVKNEATNGNAGINRSHVFVGTQDHSKPFYIRYGNKSFREQDESKRNYSYAFGLEDDGNAGMDFIVKNDVIAKNSSIVFPRQPSTTYSTVAKWNQIDVDGANINECWVNFKNSISTYIGEASEPSKVWGATDFRIDVLSDNISEVGVFPEKINDYGGQSKNINTRVFASNVRPAEFYGWFSMNLTGFNLLSCGITGMKVRDSAFAFAQNLRHAEIPNNFEFGGDHTFRMGAARTTPVKNILSTAPYGASLTLIRSKVKYQNKAAEIPTSAYYESRSIILQSKLSNVIFSPQADSSLNLSVSDSDKVHVTDGLLRNTFVNCKDLISANIQATDATVLSGTFLNCESIEDVIIPTGCATIGGYSFYGTHSLKRVSIPTSVKEVASTWASYTKAVNKKSDTNTTWINIWNTSSKPSAGNLKTKVTEKISVNSNYGVSAVTITNDNQNPQIYGKVEYIGDKEYEIDIRLSKKWDSYVTDGQLSMPLIHQEISATVNALNRVRSHFSGIIYFPIVTALKSGDNYLFRYLPPYGRVFYITDAEGHYYFTNNGPLVYDSMLLMKEFHLPTEINKVSVPTPNTKTYYAFVGDKWYSFAKGGAYTDAVYKSEYGNGGTRRTDGKTPNIFSYNESYLVFLNDSDRYYGPSESKLPYKF